MTRQGGRVGGLVYAGRAVLTFSVLVPVIELWRIAVLGRGEDLAVAIAATAAYLPLHVRHVSSGLQGRRPRGGVTTLAVMTAVIVGAWSLIGQQWVFMFASLAVSMLCALPTRYALPAAAAAVLWPLAYDWSPPIADDVYSGPYLSLSLRSAFTVHPARQYCRIPLRWAAPPARGLAPPFGVWGHERALFSAECPTTGS